MDDVKERKNFLRLVRRAASRRGWRAISRKHGGVELRDGDGKVIGTSMSPAAALAKCGGAPGRGGRPKGYKVSEEKRIKMLAHIEELAAARRGKSGNHHSPETRAAIGRKVSIALTGRTLSPEHRAALSAALKNRLFSEETRIRMRAAQRGKTHTPETIEKLRERSRAWAAEHHEHMKRMTELRAVKGRCVPLSPEHRAKVSAAMRGKEKSLDHLVNLKAGFAKWVAEHPERQKKTPEQRAKISATLRGLNLPEDIKQIIREIATEHHFNKDTDDE
jgi:hypothetical protein